MIGVDVGTGSARAGLFDLQGRLLASAKQPISLHRATGSRVEQSSTEIWHAVAQSVRSAVSEAGIPAQAVAGIGFDATCSLVVIGENYKGLPVGDADRPERDIIVWMDHRATEEAESINATKHDVLRFVGGVISPEMEMPKLLWLKKNRPDTFRAAKHFFDLTDFLTWMASGSTARSSCTVTCKWNYIAHESRWHPGYLTEIGLPELADDQSRIGTEIVTPGTALGGGLTARAAADLGLTAGTPVAAGLIDAHAGGVGTVGIEGEATENLGYVFGTSSCTMTSTKKPVFVPGVWGPYYSAMVPGLWLNEGGQSAAGAAIDHLVSLHPAYERFGKEAALKGMSLPEWLSHAATDALAGGALSSAVTLARGLHIVPEFMGNRAPFADPKARAVIAGIGIEEDLKSLVALYIAGLCGLGYGLRQIIDAQTQNGAPIQRIMISGGAGHAELVRQILADATGKPVVSGQSSEPVLLGSAILGAVAARLHDDIPAAMRAMSAPQTTVEASSGATMDIHQRRFEIFEQLQRSARDARES